MSIVIQFVIAAVLAIPITLLIQSAQEQGTRAVYREGSLCPHCRRSKLYMQQFGVVRTSATFHPVLWNEILCKKCGVVDQQPDRSVI